MAPPTGSVPVVRVAGAPAPRRDNVEERPRLEVVRPGRRFRPGLVSTVVGSVVFGALFVLAALQAVLVQGQLGLDRLDRDIAERQEQVERLRVQVATLETPARIQKAAADNGLVAPPDIVFLAPASVEPIDVTATTAAADEEG